MKLTTALRTTRATDIVTAAGSGAKLKYYNGTEALSPAGTLLAVLTITGSFGSVTSGVIDINETVTQTSSGFTAGTPTFILVTTSADVAVCTLLIGTDVTQTGTIQVGVDIVITGGAIITEGNA